MYSFYIKFAVLIPPVCVIQNTFMAVKKFGENTLTLPASLHRETKPHDTFSRRHSYLNYHHSWLLSSAN